MISNVTVVGGGSAGFMAAIALKAKLPELAVTVLRSKEIGIIGVGEGSTVPLTQFLHHFIGLGIRPFLDIACPTWKLGMKFLWGPRQHFFYPFMSDLELRLPQLRKSKAFYCGPDMDFSSGHAALMAMDKIFERGEDGKPRMHYQLAYHVENEKFVRFLETFAQHLGVQIRDDTIEHVIQDDRGVAGLKLASGATQTADLYVDCSGFRSLLLGQTLGEPFVSFKRSLLCERAIVGGWGRGADEPIHPYTTCETMDAGWCWQIEHETRINRGYVYSPDFISDDQAQAEFRAKNPKLGETRVVKFVSGRYERAWVKNVVAIGNASGFVEPLEATALAVIANRSQLLAETLIFSDREVPAVRVEMYNRHHGIVWDSIRRFLAVHYRYNPRVDSPFWRACAHDVDLAGAEPIIDYYQTCGPDAAFEALQVDRLDVFGMKGYITILVGQSVPSRYEYKPSEQEWAIWNHERRLLKHAAATAMNTEETLAALRQMGLSGRGE